MNRGPDTITDGLIQIELPEGVQPAIVPSGCDDSLRCELDPLALGEYGEVQVGLEVDPTASGTFLLRASTSSELIDGDETNNTIESEITLTSAADLSVRATVLEEFILPSGSATVRITAENRGPSTVSDAEVVFDMPPAGLAIDACELDELADTVCSIGLLASGGTTELTVGVVAAEDALGTFTIPVTLRSSAESVGDTTDERVEIQVQVLAEDPNAVPGCADCESSVSGAAGPSGLLLFVPVVAVFRRRR